MHRCRLFRRASATGQAGVAFGRSGHYVRGRMAANSSKSGSSALDDAVRGRTRPPQPPQLRGRGPLFRLVEDAPRPEPASTSSSSGPEQMGFAAARDALFAGEIVNPSEGRPATHVAERGRARPKTSISRPRGGSGCAPWSTRSRRVRSATSPASSISASAVRCSGRRCWSMRSAGAVVEAQRPLPLEHRRRRLRRCGEDARSGDDLVVVASKTFTTLETLTNIEAARDWLRRPGSRIPDGRLIAVTAKPEAAVDAGIDETRILPFGEGVGGRYSLWSSVGVTAALALGWDAFEELLEGAAEMDRHFRFAEPARERAADRRLRRPALRRGRSAARRAASSPMTSGCGCCPSISSSSRWNRTASR